MIEFFQHFPLSEIIIIITLTALAVKGGFDFYDWAKKRFRKSIDEEHNKATQQEILEERLKHGSEIMATLQKNQQYTDKILNDLAAKIDMLIDSDKDDIKSYITRQHHYFCYQKGWIDDFSLDCIEKRYDHYEDQGGNSFVGGLMDELRNLPKLPPSSKVQK